MKQNMIELYTDYILSSYGKITATGLSEMTQNLVSHDKVTRFLNSAKISGKDLWKFTKPFIREYCKDSSSGVLIVDDTVIRKPSSKENELNCWHYDHTSGKTTKGICLLSLLYSTSDLNIPAGCELVTKPVIYSDPETGKIRRKSEVSKNDMFLDLVRNAIKNQIEFEHVLGDCWFGSKENMKSIDELGKKFLFAQKSNRCASVEINGKFQDGQALESLDLQEGVIYNALLKGMDKPVHLAKQIFKNGDSACGTIYLVTNDLTLDYCSLTKLYQRRWKIEEYHKSLKSNLGLGNSPACTVTTQSNHIYLSILAFAKLEAMASTKNTNHFAFRMNIYMKAVKLCLQEIQRAAEEINLMPMVA